MWHLLVIVAWVLGWQLFDDGPLANYIITALFVASLCIREARAQWHSRMWAVYGFGALNALATAVCGALYAAEMDCRSFLCDKGTGLPASLVSGLIALLLIVWLLIREKKS
jgi:hypothetical protein